MKPTFKEKALLLAGLLLPAIISLIKHHFKVSDPLYGFFAGSGIGLELLALISLAKRKRNKLNDQ
jgi:hypothetical protein